MWLLGISELLDPGTGTTSVALKQFPAPQEPVLGVARRQEAERKLTLEFGPLAPRSTARPPANALALKGQRPLPKALLPEDLLLWEEVLGFPMYLRMGFRFLSSRASLSFLELLLC